MSFDTLFSNIVSNILKPIIDLLFVLALIYFIFGVIVFIKNADNAEKRKEGYNHIIWGVVGMFIMLSTNGIINLILATFGLK